jgi:hypothetical protein
MNHAPEKAFAANVWLITKGQVNCQPVSSLLMWKELMTVPLRGLSRPTVREVGSKYSALWLLV